MQLQISESTAVKQLEASRKRLTQLEAAVLRLEQKVDAKEQSLFHSRHESQSKVRYLKRSLQVSFSVFYFFYCLKSTHVLQY